ncbi:ATP-grasp domain-containing protein [Actinophytocola sp.]|uniref:ATP-grasp domain-containing protein n=1 Tax=Actinophytocola sp. TaxID=1872138 RepID=UPI002D5BAC9D|nr:ATP-grasp domain-containing protein [Actinophytocola sp.]HYQ69894.1 ATP-grasp domain-containing protein [Actinophytocola sp.]
MTDPDRRSDSLAVLLVVFDTGSLSPLEIVRAAAGICRPVFVVPSTAVDVGELVELLTRLAAVVEVRAEYPDVDQLRRLRPAGIVTFSDSCLELSATLARELGLCFHSPATAERLASKLAQRRALAESGLPPMRFAAVESQPDIAAAVHLVGTPAVIKPIHGSGSRDTYRVDDDTQASAVLNHLVEQGADQLIIEELLVGDPTACADWADIVSVETLFTDGKPHHLATTGRFSFASPFRETGSFMPSTLDHDGTAEAYELAERAADALGVSDGCIHTEMKRTRAGMRIIEVNGRLGGLVAWLLRRSAQLDVGALVMRAALGVPVSEWITPVTKVAFQRLLVPPTDADRLVSVDGLKQIRTIDGVESAQIWARSGDKVDWTRGYDAHLGVVSGAAQDHVELRSIIDRIDSSLDLTFM